MCDGPYSSPCQGEHLTACSCDIQVTGLDPSAESMLPKLVDTYHFCTHNDHYLPHCSLWESPEVIIADGSAHDASLSRWMFRTAKFSSAMQQMTICIVPLSLHQNIILTFFVFVCCSRVSQSTSCVGCCGPCSMPSKSWCLNLRCDNASLHYQMA